MNRLWAALLILSGFLSAFFILGWEMGITSGWAALVSVAVSVAIFARAVTAERTPHRLICTIHPEVWPVGSQCGNYVVTRHRLMSNGRWEILAEPIKSREIR